MTIQSIINNIPVLRSVLGNQQSGSQQESRAAQESAQTQAGTSQPADDQVEISDEALQRFEKVNTLSEEQVQQTLADTRNALAENEGVTLGLEEEPV
jgi:hypothetical protein